VSGSKGPHIVDRGARWRQVLSFIQGAYCPGKEQLVPIGYSAVWASDGLSVALKRGSPLFAGI
jgi:hypothetical protein